MSSRGDYINIYSSNLVLDHTTGRIVNQGNKSCFSCKCLIFIVF